MIGMTISCSDPDAMKRICVDVLGWEIAARGKIDAALESCWGLAGGSAGAEFIVHSSASGRAALTWRLPWR